ncbi:MAG: hypothetical protein ACT4N2_08490 [Hyphomicrobium sp.]
MHSSALLATLVWLASAGLAFAAEPSPSTDTRSVRKVPAAKTFPFHPWSYAKAYTFNFFEDRPAPLRVVDSAGKWSPHIRSEQMISDEQAKQAANLVAATRGSVEMTKCTFPRHAVVYFDSADRPVAAADICFSCEAVLAWPDYPKSADEDWEEAAVRLEKALPRWKKLFAVDLGLPIDYKTAPRP